MKMEGAAGFCCYDGKNSTGRNAAERKPAATCVHISPESCEPSGTYCASESTCKDDCGGTWCTDVPPMTDDPFGDCLPGSCGDGWCEAAVSSFESYPLCCPDPSPYGPVTVEEWPPEECNPYYQGCKFPGDFAYHDCSGENAVKQGSAECTYKYVYDNDLAGVLVDYNRYPTFATNMGSVLGNKKMTMKFPQQTDAQAFQARIVDTDGEQGAVPYKTGADGNPLPFQIDLEFWTALRRLPWDVPHKYRLSAKEYNDNSPKIPGFAEHARPSGSGYMLADPAESVSLGAESDDSDLTQSTICIKKPSTQERAGGLLSYAQKLGMSGHGNGMRLFAPSP